LFTHLLNDPLRIQCQVTVYLSISTERPGRVVGILLRIREVRGWNLGPDISYSD